MQNVLFTALAATEEASLCGGGPTTTVTVKVKGSVKGAGGGASSGSGGAVGGNSLAGGNTGGDGIFISMGA